MCIFFPPDAQLNTPIFQAWLCCGTGYFRRRVCKRSKSRTTAEVRARSRKRPLSSERQKESLARPFFLLRRQPVRYSRLKESTPGACIPGLHTEILYRSRQKVIPVELNGSYSPSEKKEVERTEGGGAGEFPPQGQIHSKKQPVTFVDMFTQTEQVTSSKTTGINDVMSRIQVMEFKFFSKAQHLENRLNAMEDLMKEMRNIFIAAMDQRLKAIEDLVQGAQALAGMAPVHR
ncbi:uncharacterized protein LOC133379818 [Rhineura floridana]|uniref:uncharacterized protein LOC133379818 n=1 Tax=Rhineura floridana TaxID=261503 RepID=UPI002AC7ED5F|nr:uncharacterized protein LOC133379818 [Rhineura floridana]